MIVIETHIETQIDHMNRFFVTSDILDIMRSKYSLDLSEKNKYLLLSILP